VVLLLVGLLWWWCFGGGVGWVGESKRAFLPVGTPLVVGDSTGAGRGGATRGALRGGLALLARRGEVFSALPGLRTRLRPRYLLIAPLDRSRSENSLFLARLALSAILVPIAAPSILLLSCFTSVVVLVLREGGGGGCRTGAVIPEPGCCFASAGAAMGVSATSALVSW
jgi:hypothetical protein